MLNFSFILSIWLTLILSYYFAFASSFTFKRYLFYILLFMPWLCDAADRS